MQRSVLATLLVAAAAYAGSPLVLPAQVDWTSWSLRLLGFAIVVLVFLAYGALAARGKALLPEARGFRLGSREVALLLAFPLYVVFIGNGLVMTSADNTATRALGPLLLTKGTFDLSSLPAYQTRRLHYSAIRIGDRILPSFPIGTGILSVPYAALAVAASGGRADPALADRWEKHLSALLAVASAVLLFLGVRRRFGEPAGLRTALVFALGTTTFSCVSQALWSTTGEVFFVAVALAATLPEEAGPAQVAGAGLAIGAAFLCRPTALVAAVAVGLLLAGRRPQVLVAYAAAATASAGAAALLLQRLYGHPLGGYALINEGSWGTHVVQGLAGGLLSPSRGLLVFFPYLLFVPLGAARLGRDPRLRQVFLAALAASLGTYALASGYDKWWGGKSVGPRLMTEAAPFLALLVLPVWLRWRQLGISRALFGIALLFSIATQALSTYTVRGEAWSNQVDVDRNPDALWSVRGSQIVALWWPAAARAAPPR